ncbi:MAG: hypothetical protein LBK18_01625 [Prevotellaceae bacterium]|nr:hypothetical protein [Prevotellaceae bacterium]
MKLAANCACIHLVPIMLSLFLLALTSCDWHGGIAINNQTGGKATVRFYILDTTDGLFDRGIGAIHNKWTAQRQIINQYCVADEDGDSLFVHEINLPGADGGNQYYMVVAFGLIWDNNYIQRYANNLKKIEIISPKGTTVVEGSRALFKYLKKHRRWGLIGNNDKDIVISIKK